MTKDEILAALPALTRPDLEQVQAMATTLLAGRLSNIEAPAGTLAGPLLNALCEAVGLTVAPSNLSGTTSGKTFEKHLPAIKKFLDAYFKGWDRQVLSQTAFLRMLMELLRDDLKKRNVTPSVGIMINNLLRLPEIFEDAYPGYLEAGLGDMVLRHFTKVRLSTKAQMARKKPRRI